MKYAWLTLVSAAILIPVGCASRLPESGGRLIVVKGLAEPPESVWDRLADGARDLGLILTELRPEEGVLQFDWITAPGDARFYLRCNAEGSVGSAFLRPRIRVHATEGGSRIVVSAEVRATTTSACESTGHFENWLLGRLAAPGAVTGTTAADSPDD